MDVSVSVDVVKVDVNVLEHVEIAETVQHVHVVKLAPLKIKNVRISTCRALSNFDGDFFGTDLKSLNSKNIF